MIRNMVRLGRSIKKRFESRNKIQKYLRGERLPWSEGYLEFRDDYISKVLDTPEMLELFRKNSALPDSYGLRLDERVIEYPWTLSRIDNSRTLCLDAGSALNHDFLLNSSALQEKSLIIYSLYPEGFLGYPNVSYIFGDLRATILRDGVFGEIICISTLEHVGLDNTMLYTSDPDMNQQNLTDYRLVMREFRRVLAPGGRLILTVPFGKRKSHGWLQVFDGELLDDAVRAFEGLVVDQAFYRYTPGGWVLSDRGGCGGCDYFDIHNQEGASDHAAAARGVACLELSRSS